MVVAVYIFIVIITFALAMQDIIKHYPSTAFPFLSNGKLKRWLLRNDPNYKYINGDKSQGRKRFYIGKIGIIIPVAFMDGWHFFRFILVTAIITGNSFALLNDINFYLSFAVQSVIYLGFWYVFYETSTFAGRKAIF
jgi:hypothetical protein